MGRIITCRRCDRPIDMSGFCFTLAMHMRGYRCCGKEKEDTMRNDDFDPRKFPTLGEWYAAVHRRGVPTAVPAGIQATMSELGIAFHEAFALLIAESALLPAGTGYVIDLAGPVRVIEKYRRP